MSNFDTTLSTQKVYAHSLKVVEDTPHHLENYVGNILIPILLINNPGYYIAGSFIDMVSWDMNVVGHPPRQPARALELASERAGRGEELA